MSRKRSPEHFRMYSRNNPHVRYHESARHLAHCRRCARHDFFPTFIQMGRVAEKRLANSLPDGDK